MGAMVAKINDGKYQRRTKLLKRTTNGSETTAERSHEHTTQGKEQTKRQAIKSSDTVTPKKERSTPVIKQIAANDTQECKVDKSPSSDYIDYTLVPLLLRSGVAYKHAEKFGKIVQTQFSSSQVEDFMTDPCLLMDVIVQENVKVSSRFFENLKTDTFWSQGSSRRRSYVYFRSSMDASAVEDQRCRSQVQMQPRPRRRSEFTVPIEDMQETKKNKKHW